MFFIYTVYMHENKVNHKRYFGITSRDVWERWGSKGNGYYRNTHFYNSIKKYGWDNFDHTIIAEGLTHQEALDMERYLITYYHTNHRDYGYNLDNGGSGGGKMSDETKQKLRESHLGRHHSNESKMRMSKAKSGKNNPNYGKKLPEWHKQALMQGRMKSEYTQEQREKLISARGFRVLQYDLNGKFLNKFKSTGEASRNTGVDRSCIKACCNKQRRYAGDYYWRYEKDGYVEGDDLDLNDIPKKGIQKTVYQYDLNGNFIQKHSGCTEASLTIYGDKSKSKGICDCCNGRQNIAFGYIWSYNELCKQ